MALKRMGAAAAVWKSGNPQRPPETLETLNPKPETLNPKPYRLNSDPKPWKPGAEEALTSGPFSVSSLDPTTLKVDRLREPPGSREFLVFLHQDAR